MSKVSKTPLPFTDEISLFQQLTRLLSGKSDLEINLVLHELLGREEKLMLAKRFAIIALLWRKQTLYSIAKKLHVSTSTVARINMRYELGHYENLVASFETQTISILGILETIDDLLHLGGILPHYGQTHRSEAYQKAKAQKL